VDAATRAADHVVCARHGALLEGESPLHTRQGEVLAKGKGVVVRRGLKEACSKALARRTETAYEARLSDEKARYFKVLYLSGRQLCKCGGHKRESSVTLPGEISHLASCYRRPEASGYGVRSQPRA